MSENAKSGVFFENSAFWRRYLKIVELNRILAPEAPKHCISVVAVQGDLKSPPGVRWSWDLAGSRPRHSVLRECDRIIRIFFLDTGSLHFSGDYPNLGKFWVAKVRIFSSDFPVAFSGTTMGFAWASRVLNRYDSDLVHVSPLSRYPNLPKIYPNLGKFWVKSPYAENRLHTRVHRVRRQIPATQLATRIVRTDLRGENLYKVASGGPTDRFFGETLIFWVNLGKFGWILGTFHFPAQFSQNSLQQFQIPSDSWRRKS